MIINERLHTMITFDTSLTKMTSLLKFLKKEIESLRCARDTYTREGTYFSISGRSYIYLTPFITAYAYENLDDNHDDNDGDEEGEDDTHERERKDEKKRTYIYTCVRTCTHTCARVPHGRVTSSEWARGFVDPRGGVRTMNERVNEYNLCQLPLPPRARPFLPFSIRFIPLGEFLLLAC